MSKKCVICGCEYKGFGNNPYPIREEPEKEEDFETGMCCDWCNINLVIPLRSRMVSLKAEKTNIPKWKWER